MSDKVTIHDVADKAQVSIATVSRALNGNGSGGSIKPATREAVRAAAEELGYKTPTDRVAAKEQRPKLIGCIVPDLVNPFYAELAQTIIDQARLQSCRVVVLTVGEDTPQAAKREAIQLAKREAVQLLIRMRVQGIIAIPTGSSTELSPWQSALDQRIALAFVDRDLDRALQTVDTITVDNKKAARDATWHLFTNGHTKVGILTGPEDVTTLDARLAGFEEAYRDRGLSFEQRFIQRATFDEGDRLRAARNLVAMHPDLTAVFATSNLFGESMITAIREVWDENKEVWDDERNEASDDERKDQKKDARRPSFCDFISLVMFDDVPWAQLISPRITAVENPAPTLAKTALDRLLDRMRPNHLTLPARHIVMRTGGLQVRESVSDIHLLKRLAAEKPAR